jgi:hypothetical protein
VKELLSEAGMLLITNDIQEQYGNVTEKKGFTDFPGFGWRNAAVEHNPKLGISNSRFHSRFQSVKAK